MNKLDPLIKLSQYAGMREDLVQAGGGNTSIKLDHQKMAIKSSGIQLADISANHGYSILDYRKISRFMETLATDSSACSGSEILKEALIEGGRPSIETFLHAITGRVTLHVHAVAVNVLTSRKGGMEQIQKLFPDALLVGYATPGLELAKLYYQTYLEESGKRGKTDFPIIFLKNHGVIVSGNTAEEVICVMEEVTQKIEKAIGMDNTAYRRAFELYEHFISCGFHDGKIVVKAENESVLNAFRSFNDSFWEHQICPDSIVFLGKKVLNYATHGQREKLQEFVHCNGIPVIIQDRKELFIRAESVKKAREIESVLAFSARVALFNREHPMELLTEEEQNFLLDWDAEKYRQQIK